MQIVRQATFANTRKIGTRLFALLVYPFVISVLLGVSWPEYVPVEVQIYTAIFAIFMVGFGLLIAHAMLEPVPDSEFAKPNNQPQIAQIPKKQFVILGGLLLTLTHFIAFKGIAEHILTYINAQTVMMERPILGVSQNTWNISRSRKDHIYSTYILETQSTLGEPFDVTHFRHSSAKSWTIADGKCVFMTLRRGWHNVAAVHALKTGPCRSEWQPSAGFKLKNFNKLRLDFRSINFNDGIGYPKQPNPFCVVQKGKSSCALPVMSARALTSA